MYRQEDNADQVFQGGNFLNVPAMYSPEHIRAWKVVTDAVHARGGYMVCQLWHVRLPPLSTHSLPLSLESRQMVDGK